MLGLPKWDVSIQLMRLDKPIGIYLLLYPTLWALIIAAEGMPSWSLTLIFTLGAILMRSAGCVINDYADREWDGAVSRTVERPLATGAATGKQAISLFVLLLCLAAILLIFLDPTTQLWSLGAVALAVIYPFTKRYTHFPQVVLGAAFSWSIPMAFSAQQGEVPWICWYLYLLNLLWTLAYDTLYAMVDRDDDRQVGIKSTAILFGRHDRSIVALLYFLVFMMLVSLTARVPQPLIFALGLCLVLGLFISQIRQFWNRDRQACFQCFLANRHIGLVVTLSLLAAYHW